MQQEFIRFIKDYLRSLSQIMIGHYLGKDIMRESDFEPFYDFCMQKASDIYRYEGIIIEPNAQMKKWVGQLVKICIYDSNGKSSEVKIENVILSMDNISNSLNDEFRSIYRFFQESVNYVSDNT